MNSLRLLLAAAMRLSALRRWPVRRVLMKQLYFCGIEALPLLLFIGISVGGIVVAQLHYQIGQSGEGSLSLLARITLAELAPMLTAILLTARSSSAMASELAMMRLHGELAALARMGVDVRAYLVMPRIVGMMLANTVLTCYFALAALLTGAVAVAGFGWLTELARLPTSLSVSTLWLCLAKSVVFGAAMATVACARGLSGGLSVTDVPIAASSAVIRAVLTLFALDLGFILLGHIA
ncbi:ABC transporter permease [Chitinimonas arctica]|uniref:ABC transporter permease n=1 Tax=Chitinimonas arctica TaxID=2594795 RepID=A0A516SAR5_9NEIS|nr:ABC transporter permease [Chitinimonas arctica]QDQ25242.1 ABC transporter permease [Chitinimonas arctica]